MNRTIPALTLATCVFALVPLHAAERPNILWIIGEDASPHLGCYGETAIDTPHLDKLAEQGIRFTNAYVTCPVCSPCRSALVTGMYQTSLGAHNHRSQTGSGKGAAHSSYFDSYRLPVKTIPRLFKGAGYWTSNGNIQGKPGKTDYNFIWNKSDYDSGDWKGRKLGQPFFAQIQLSGGKGRNDRHRPDVAQIKLPPYYPRDRVILDDWARYLSSWVSMDLQVGKILARLDEEGIADKTAVFFLTDHGVSHLRGKQFLYDEGIRVPLIVRLPGGKQAGTVNDDLVEHIDLATTSLALAGIAVPEHLQGNDLFAKDAAPRSFVFSARDRCDETVDIIRCVRTKRYKYIRNFLPHMPHAQPSQYKDGKKIIQTMRQLHAAGVLTSLQARPFAKQRPAEELYDLEADPFETTNLVNRSDHEQVRDQMRSKLAQHMIEHRDLGIVPEPILEEIGRKSGNKYHALDLRTQTALVRRMIGPQTTPRKKSSGLAAIDRYWSATAIGLSEIDDRKKQRLVAMLDDDSRGVRVAAALALCRAGDTKTGVPALAALIDDENYLVGMYALRALEIVGPPSRAVLPQIKAAQKSPYEFTRRIARRLTKTLGS